MYAKKLFEGSLVITLTFYIVDVEPVEKIDIEDFQKQLFVYDFRKN